QGNDQSGNPSISADGRYVAFDSYSTNFGPDVLYHRDEVYVRDLQAGTTTLVSVAPDGTTPGNAVENEATAISADGRYVAFQSYATNLVAGDTNNLSDVFVRDMTTGITTRVSVDSNGNQDMRDYSSLESISADGRYVLFDTDFAYPLATQNTIQRLWLHDRQSGATIPIGLSSSGAIANGNAGGARMSADDRYVLFSSWGDNLVACDTNHDWDGFIRDLKTGTTTRVTLAGNGGQQNQGGGIDARSADGRYLLLDSWSSNMVTGDTNNVGDIFRRDTRPGATPNAPLFGVTGPAVAANLTSVPITGCGSSGTTVHLTVRDSTHRAVVTVPVSRGQWSTKLNLSGFADGKLTVMAYVTNSAGATSGRAYATLIKDLARPTARITAPTSRSLARTTSVTWSGTDKGSGIASYALRWRYGRSRLSAYAYVARATTQTQRTFTLAAATTYCWSIRARDNAGNPSTWSPDTCGTTH
ncbi:MAG: PD40 domain-containing protein, partial [Frankiaceae bacterium]|nr:PD40 domain-containing protein [Frankiaceae bacterium]